MRPTASPSSSSRRATTIGWCRPATAGPRTSRAPSASRPTRRPRGGAGAASAPCRHALIAAFGGDTVAAARLFAERYHGETNITVLVDFENDSVRTALEVADALGDAPVGGPAGHERAARRRRAAGRARSRQQPRCDGAAGPSRARRARRRRPPARADRRLGRLRRREDRAASRPRARPSTPTAWAPRCCAGRTTSPPTSSASTAARWPRPGASENPNPRLAARRLEAQDRRDAAVRGELGAVAQDADRRPPASARARRPPRRCRPRARWRCRRPGTLRGSSAPSQPHVGQRTPGAAKPASTSSVSTRCSWTHGQHLGQAAGGAPGAAGERLDQPRERRVLALARGRLDARRGRATHVVGARVLDVDVQPPGEAIAQVRVQVGLEGAGHLGGAPTRSPAGRSSLSCSNATWAARRR